jgi:hypothetical protein
MEIDKEFVHSLAKSVHSIHPEMSELLDYLADNKDDLWLSKHGYLFAGLDYISDNWIDAASRLASHKGIPAPVTLEESIRLLKNYYMKTLPKMPFLKERKST